MRKLAFAVLTSLALAAVPSVAMANPNPTGTGSGLGGSDSSSTLQTALQLTMDSYTALMEALSNLMKSESGTQGSIVGNIKP